MAMPDTNAFKVLRAQKPHTDEELELIQGTVFQRAVPEFAPVCNDRQTCPAGFKQQPNLPVRMACADQCT